MLSKGNDMTDEENIIRQLNLEPLPGEGGYFRETYRSNIVVPSNALDKSYLGSRRMGTAIYYLLNSKTCSLMHRLPGDEIFHFYLGDPVEMLQLRSDNDGEIIQLGNDILHGLRPQVLVPGGTWQGSRLLPGGKYALMGTTMAPGFEFSDFVLGLRADLIERYPHFSELIIDLTAP